jgi:hypothetical protein
MRVSGLLEKSESALQAQLYAGLLEIEEKVQ